MMKNGDFKHWGSKLQTLFFFPKICHGKGIEWIP
jgi:hypothetical protein